MRYMRILMLLLIFVVAGKLSLRAEDKAQFLQWNFKLSGEERLRFEYKKDFDFNTAKTAKDSGGLLSHRFRIGEMMSLTDEYLNPYLDIFVEGLDAKSGGYHIKAVKTQIDDFDLHQAYANIYNIAGSDFDVKLGRFELKYGNGRLIAAPTWSNAVRAFDGGVLKYHKGPFWADIIYGQDVKYKDDYFNVSRSEEFLTGIYGGYQKNKVSPLIEAYFLELHDIKAKNDLKRYTVGARLRAILLAGIVLDVEVPYQFGKTTTATVKRKDIKAYAWHIDLSKSWDMAFWKPKLTIAYDEASGDDSSTDGEDNTFVPLYQSTHDPYGLMDMFRWQNVRCGELGVTLFVTDKFKVTPQADFFWLQNKNAPWYSSSGTAFRSKTSGKRNSFVGSELSLRGAYEFTKELKLESGYAHFFCGPYVKASGAHHDADWFYMQASYKF